jgi:hypothetical protein
MINWKACGWKWLWPDWRYCLGICVAVLMKMMKTLVKTAVLRVTKCESGVQSLFDGVRFETGFVA